MAQKIIPNIWFDGNAKEAVEFYVDAFANSRILSTASYPETKEEGLADFQLDLAGKVLQVDYELEGFRFLAINADDTFKVNQSISFFVNFDLSRYPEAFDQLDALWDKLIEGGEALLDKGQYPFSKRYGWLRDKFGVTWQLIVIETDPTKEELPYIMPSLGFGNDVANRANEAIDYYTTLFKNSKRGATMTYGEPQGYVKAGSLAYGDFTLEGQWFAAMDGPFPPEAVFNEGVSLAVNCKDQEEIDYFWNELSTVPEAEQCGWCKDKFGVSWQIVPENMGELMSRPGAYPKMMAMHKIVIADF